MPKKKQADHKIEESSGPHKDQIKRPAKKKKDGTKKKDAK
jgi:hypothetical protein